MGKLAYFCFVKYPYFKAAHGGMELAWSQQCVLASRYPKNRQRVGRTPEYMMTWVWYDSDCGRDLVHDGQGIS